jgi:hypothetical protein
MDVARAFIDQSRRLLTQSYLPRIEGAVDGLPPENLWWRANEHSNSIGNLMLHLSGNARQWIVSGVGGRADVRERAREFAEQGPMPGDQLMSRLTATVNEVDAVLAALDPDTLGERRRIQSYEVTVMQAIYTVVEHFSMHSGQIILLAKMWKGDMGFYDLSGGNPRPTWQRGTAGQ